MAGKHVLLEKPSTSSAKDTKSLVDLAEKKGLVLLEAFHYRACAFFGASSAMDGSLLRTNFSSGFHPAALRFKEIVDSGELGKIVSADAKLLLPAQYFMGRDDIRFNYSLGGGAMTDVGERRLTAI
jgi:predicted dehydrogenase